MSSLRDGCMPALHVWQSLRAGDCVNGRRPGGADPDADAAADELPFGPRRRLSRAATAAVVDDALGGGDEGGALARLRARLDAAGVRLARCGVQYRDVAVTRPPRRAAAGDGASGDALPSLLDPVRAAAAAVRCAPAPARGRPALAAATGVLRPRTMTLILGPSGAGKTTLLRVLSGRLRGGGGGGGTRVTGVVALNGVRVLDADAPPSAPAPPCSWPRTVAYVGNVDHHLPTLTVAETLRFAERCSGGDPGTRDAVAALVAAEAVAGTPLDPADAALSRLAAAVTNPANGASTEWVLRALRLTGCAATVVGDAMLRGISGGERRRVSTAELLVGAARVLCLNAPSTGLDSASTLALAASLRASADTLDVAVLAALLAPEPDAVAFFDDVILMAHGRVLYHGPLDGAGAYFNLPATATATAAVADALLALATALSPADADALGDAWAACPAGAALAAAAAAPTPPDAGPPGDLCPAGHAAPPTTLLAACIARAATVDYARNWPAFAIRWALAAAMSAAVGSLFLTPPLTPAGGQARLAALFFQMFFVLTLAVPTVETTFERRPIVLRQRDDGLYPGAADVAAQALLAAPVALVDAVCVALPLALLADIAPAPPRRAAVVALFFLLGGAVDALYRLFGGAFPSLTTGVAVGVVLLLALEATAGFTLAAASIPPWWKWLHYVNPMAWAWRALAIVELTDARWGDDGRAVLALFDVDPSPAWAWGGGAFLAGFWAVGLAACALVYTIKRAPEPERGGGGGGGVPAPPALDGGAKPVVVAVDRAAAVATPLALAAVGVSYTVPSPRSRGAPPLTLLSDVTASFEPGTLTALMGASGAGKTTLLDVLAGRKTAGTVSGAIYVGGKKVDAATLPRVAAYVEQADNHMPLTTVREAVEFSAALRLPRATRPAARAAAVDAALATAGLTSAAPALVAGLPPDAAKRLTLAVELAAGPTILFADEPTSGLDGVAAAAVARALAAAAATGRTVVATIHQPSRDVFATFDGLLLLAAGGRVAYCGPLGGPGAPALVAHLSRALPAAAPPPPGANPAAWAVGLDVGAAADAWAADAETAAADASTAAPRPASAAAAALTAARRASADGAGAGARPAPGPTFATQLAVLTRRGWRGYGRDPGRNAVRFAVAAAMAALLASLDPGKAAPGRVTSLQSLNNALGVVYLAVVSLAFDVSFEAQPFLAAERVVFYRERAAGAYGPAPFALATLAVEVPYLTAATLLYALPVAAAVGAAPSVGAAAYFAAVAVLTTLALWLLAAALVHVTPIVFLASLLLSVLTALSSLLAGYFVPWGLAPPAWAWTRALNPAAYAVSGVASFLYGGGGGGGPVVADAPGGPAPLADVLAATYWFGGGRFPSPGAALGGLAAVCGVCAGVAYAGLRWLNFQAR